MKRPKIKISEIVDDTTSRIRKAPKQIIEYGAKYTVGLGFWIFMIVIFIIGILFFAEISGFVKDIVYAYGFIGIFIAAILTELVVMPIGPDVPLIAGILIGLNHWLVLASILAGAYLAIIISYYVGYKIGLPGVERIMGTKNFEKIKKHETKGKWFLLIGALTPVPYVPYFAGVWKLSLKDTILYVAAPRTLRLVFVFVLAYYLGIFLFD